MDLIYLIPIAIVFSYLINVLADILPEDKPGLPPACTNCHTKYLWLDYLLFKRCTGCKKNTSIRRWIVLIFCILVTLLIRIYPPPRSQHPLYMQIFLGLIFYFLLVFLIDLEHRLILYSISLVGIVFAIPVGIYLHGTVYTFIGLGIGAGIMFLLFLLGLLFNVMLSKIRKRKIEEIALGFGDVLLAGIIGLLLGYPGIFLALLVAILMGGLVSLIYMVAMKLKGKYEVFTAIPYGPFLIISALIFLYLVK